MNNKADCNQHKHPDYKHEIPKLNRAIGQLEGVKKMINEHRYCPDILTQLKAARCAIKAIEKNILLTHLENCVAESFINEKNVKEKILEIKKLIDKMNE